VNRGCVTAGKANVVGGADLLVCVYGGSLVAAGKCLDAGCGIGAGKGSEGI
jgi:hypothetical protein